MKWIVRAFLLLITLVFIVLAGATYMLVTFDPNNYKTQIAQAVSESTGRTFAIEGDISATVFPVLGFTANAVRLGNPDGFGGGDFLTVGKLQAGVKVEPLFQQKIELTKVTLVEPSINVIKLANGKSNADFPKGEEINVESGTATDMPPMDLSVEEIEVTNAKVTYDDRAKGEKWAIDPLNLNLPGFKPGDNTPVKIDMTMKRGDDMAVRVNANATMKAAPKDGTFTLTGAQADITLKSPALTSDVNVSLRGDMNLDQKAETLEGKNMKLSWQGTDITSEVTVKKFRSAPHVSFTASAPNVDIDALMAAFKKKDKAGNDESDLMPFDVIRNLGLDGTIKIDSLKVTGLAATGVYATLKADNGVLKIAPLTATLYEGAFDSSITVDARNNTPTLSAAGGVDNVQVGPILQAKAGQDFLTGKAGFKFDLRGTGRTLTAVRSSSGGSFGFDFGEGYINKWELSKRINQAIAYFETGEMTENVSDKIYFTSLDGTFTGQNGVFTNSDLELLAPKSHALGSGTVNFARSTVDYSLRVGLGDDPEKVKDASHLPIRISGPLSKPQYALDVQALVHERFQEKIDEKKDELLNKAFEKLSGKKQEPAAAAPADGEAVAAPDATPEAAPEKEPDTREQLLRGLLGGSQ